MAEERQEQRPTPASERREPEARFTAQAAPPMTDAERQANQPKEEAPVVRLSGDVREDEYKTVYQVGDKLMDGNGNVVDENGKILEPAPKP